MSFYITTAIDYPNALPHIGTAYEKILADAYCRYLRFMGRKAYLLMGNDENTLKIKQAVGDNPQEYVNQKAFQFKTVWKALDIDFDHFIQTSSIEHREGVQHFLQTLKDVGLIEKRKYKSWYCEGCEEFKKDDVCLTHLQPLVLREEENYFFLLSELKQDLDAYFDCELEVQPSFFIDEMRAFRDEMKDISISRPNDGWGVPVPWDNSQVVYVWFDALLSYLTGIGFPYDWQKLESLWPANVHFIGKDIVRFHTILLPAMVIGYNRSTNHIELPHKFCVHGFINEKNSVGEIVKASKSGEATSPMTLVEQFGADAVRYYFLSQVKTGSDFEFSMNHFKAVYNADLANSLGNLVSRTVNLMPDEIPVDYFPNHKLVCYPLITYEDLLKFAGCQNGYDFAGAIKHITAIVDGCNREYDLQQPWKLPEDKKKYVLRFMAINLKTIALMLLPIIPETARKIYNCFEWEEAMNWNALNDLSKGFTGVVKLKKQEFKPLFPRIK